MADRTPMNIRIRKRRMQKKGSIFVEAAMVLPVFIIAVCTIAFVMRVYAACETAAYTAVNSARLMMQEAPFHNSMPVFPLALRQAVKEETGFIDEAVCLNYRYDSEGEISFDLVLATNPHLPIDMIGERYYIENFTCRSFCGKDNSKTTFAVSGEEEIPDDEMVYIFPDYGTKYHKGDCTYVVSNPIGRVLSSSVRKKYSPCSMCGSKKATTGQQVFIFRYGDSYHLGTCRSVTRYVVEMEKQSAIEKGYTPCSKCGG